MTNTTIKLNYNGIGAMLRGEEMKELVKGYGKRGAEAAGQGYGYDTHNTGQRQAATFFPETNQAKSDNLNNNTLIKAMGTLHD